MDKKRVTCEFNKLNLSDGDVVHVRYPSDAHIPDMMDFADRGLRPAIKDCGKDIKVLITPHDVDIATLSDDELAKVGLFRVSNLENLGESYGDAKQRIEDAMKALLANAGAL
ncbi:MAG: hypothetical protein ACRCUB_17970 [Plesiomonas shigelloides]